MEQRDVPVLFYSYMVDGKTYTDDMGRDPQALPNFYQMLADGAMPTTAQLNAYQYEEFFDGLLQKGDVLHIALGTGMTQSVQNARIAAENLREKYPERKLIVIDSFCSSSGYGLLVDTAADHRDAGEDIDTVADWVRSKAKRVHHQFYSTRRDMYRRSGRMSGAAAAIATVLNICPIMRLDDAGKIIAYDKVRGKKAAVARTVDMMEAHADGGKKYDDKCFICHSNCLEDAEITRDAVEARFPKLKGRIRICDIGTIIASHCGPGTVAVFFFGDERAPEK
jgi:DegV family protein with EDD domain